jgi:hypothetical protein
MRKLFAVVSFAILSVFPTSLAAWWDGGHMQIAALAYERLTPQARTRVDALVKLNPDYPSWVGCLPVDQKDKLAFIRASAWADDIKTDANYTDANDRPDGPDAGRNNGYSDKLRHKYWHYMDIGFSTDGAPVRPADPVNALTQIKLFRSALAAGSGVSDAVRSYDLVWLLHLVADVHQPLHATARFSQGLPSGDNGGNKVLVRPATGEAIQLHFYWDRMFGGYTTAEGAVRDAHDHDGLAQVPVDQELAVIDDPEIWIRQSYEAARKFAYAEPVLSGMQPIELTRQYETEARSAARAQAALAAERLARMLNAVLQ